MPTTPVTGRIGSPVPSSRKGLRLPHERDESSTDVQRTDQIAPVQADQMEQARQDMEGPQQDTDCRARPQSTDSACPPGPVADASPAVPEPNERTDEGATRQRPSKPG